METHILKVSGMTCGHCARTVERSAKGAAGVADATVDLAQGQLVARGGERSVIIAAVRAAGYGAE